MRRLRHLALVLAVACAAVLVVVAPARGASWQGACGASASGDFNGDDASDLAIGVPNEDSDEHPERASSGAVNVIYGGGPDGLLSDGDQFVDQDTAGVADSTDPGDLFGACVAAGDFNGDGYSDLAIAAPGEDRPARTEAEDLANVGQVHVIYGSPDGLDPSGDPQDQLWHQDVKGVPGGNEEDDEWGTSLAAGDFNGDGRDDLAIGAPEEAIGTRSRAGAVWVLRGSDVGLTASGAQIWHQNSKLIAGSSEIDDNFAGALAAGDLDGDGQDDLAVGVAFEDIGTSNAAGAVNILYGANAGLTATNNKLWHQDSSAGVLETIAPLDRFGDAVAIGDFDGDGFGDLAVGVPGENTTKSDDGLVHVFIGSDDGITADDEIYSQADVVNEAPEDGDEFASTLNAADYDGDGFDDLTVGIPLEDIDGAEDAGAICIFFGSDDTDEVLQSAQAVSRGGDAVAGDLFGAAVTAGNYSGLGNNTVAVGVPRFDVQTGDNAGAVFLGGGSATSTWTQDSPDIDGVAERNDHFGIVAG